MTVNGTNMVKVDKPDGGWSIYPGSGEKWTCTTDGQVQQTWGEGVFLAGKMAEQRLVAMNLVQNVSSKSPANVVSDVVTK